MAYLTYGRLEHVGRLGNQLWQIASTIGLARTYGLEPRFPAGWSYRPYFNIPEQFFAPVPDALEVTQQTWPELSRCEVSYLQDLALFEKSEDEVRHYLAPTFAAKEQFVRLLTLSDRRPRLVLHIRRGDNVYDPWVPDKALYYPVPPTDYYLNAVRVHGGFSVIIFGDDHEWNSTVLLPRVQEICPFDVQVVRGVPRPKEHEGGYFSEPILDWIDLFAMSYGTAYCLSNSTLGWWGAWLSRSEDVTIPDPWYGPNLAHVNSDLMMPKTWKKVPAC